MAVTIEFGKCGQCNENNPKQLKACRKCNAPLPWAKAPKPKISKAAPVRQQAVARSVPQLDWGILGIGAISFFIPIIGYFLYRSYSESGDDKASIALIAAILGVLAHVARVAIRAAS
jgi:hypothetical protein